MIIVLELIGTVIIGATALIGIITSPIWIPRAARRLAPKQKIEMPVRPKRRAF